MGFVSHDKKIVCKTSKSPCPTGTFVSIPPAQPDWIGSELYLMSADCTIFLIFILASLHPNSKIMKTNYAENPFDDFKKRFKLLAEKHPNLVTNTLSNIFTMRLVGNKTHGDLAEIGIVEFINQFMYDFKSIHVGKDLFRAKEREEDIVIINELNKVKFPVSLKAYGDGPFATLD
jgi:hypothetical protein